MRSENFLGQQRSLFFTINLVQTHLKNNLLNMRHIPVQTINLLFKNCSKSMLMLAGILTASSMIGTPAQAQVIGNDDRVTPDYNWMVNTGRQPIGRLEMKFENGQYGSCSFTIVGRNIGITNTHCVRDKNGKIATQIKAFSLQYGSRNFASANVDSVWTGLNRFPTTVNDFSRDWAVIRFNSNLGTTAGSYGNLGYSNSQSNLGSTVVNKSTNMIGYSGDWPTALAIRPGQVRGQTPGAHFGCSITKVENGVLIHTCDGTPGSSGSSLSDTNKQVMGLHWGQLTYPNGVRVGGGVALERFMPAVQQLRSNGAASNSVVPVP